MIYHRKAETVRAIQITDCSPEMVAKVAEFTQGHVMAGNTYYGPLQDYVSVAVGNQHLRLLQGDWLIHSVKGWRKMRDMEFKAKYEEGEHGQERVDQTVE